MESLKSLKDKDVDSLLQNADWLSTGQLILQQGKKAYQEYDHNRRTQANHTAVDNLRTMHFLDANGMPATTAAQEAVRDISPEMRARLRAIPGTDPYHPNGELVAGQLLLSQKNGSKDGITAQQLLKHLEAYGIDAPTLTNDIGETLQGRMQELQMRQQQGRPHGSLENNSGEKVVEAPTGKAPIDVAAAVAGMGEHLTGGASDKTAAAGTYAQAPGQDKGTAKAIG